MERIDPTGKPATTLLKTITNVSFGSQYKITMATGLIFEAHAGSRSLYYSVQAGVRICINKQGWGVGKSPTKYSYWMVYVGVICLSSTSLSINTLDLCNIHMWQSRVHYSVAYFNCVTMFKVL